MNLTWAPSERLIAEDLNAAFAEVAKGRMPGARCPLSAEQTVGNTVTELPIGQPLTALDDVGGYYQSGRLVIPRGFAGWYLATFRISGMAGGVKGDQLRIAIRGMGTGGAVPLPVPGGPAAGEWTLTVLDHVPDLNAIWVEAATSTTGLSAQLLGVNLVRLASFGAYK